MLLTRHALRAISRNTATLGLLLAALPLGACDPGGGSGSSGSSDTRVAEFDPTHPKYTRFEADGAQNACSTDVDCGVSGCSREVCAAESVSTTCEVLDDPPRGDCLCVEATCLWAKPVIDECSSDADCRAASNYCGACRCHALAGDEEPVQCENPVVCVTDPCEFMTAVCDRGSCALVARSR